MSKPKIIVIEGPDKLGKQTQTKLLLSALRDLDLDGDSVEIPYNDGYIYKKIYKMLESGDASKYPRIFQTLQYANRLLWQNEKYKDYECCGTEFLILDRWTVSGWVYGKASGLSDNVLNMLSEDLVIPDLVFVFKGKSFKTKDRGDDCYESDNDFQFKVRNCYNDWLKNNKDIGVPVNANRDKKIILSELVEKCKEILNEQ